MDVHIRAFNQFDRFGGLLQQYAPPRYIRGLERVSAHVDWEKIDGFTGSEKAVRAALGVGDGSWQQNNYSFTVAAEKSLTLQIAQLTISYRHFLPLL